MRVSLDLKCMARAIHLGGTNSGSEYLLALRDSKKIKSEQ